MCGIFGVVRRRDRDMPDEGLVRASAGRLAHRGPDSSGIWRGPGVAFGHTRLALVDLDPRSDQPFRDPDGRHVLVFNGEVYNFKALRAELEAEGVAFRTASDTEVVFRALIHRPWRDALRSFEGMFALGFLDNATGELLLARDRFGMKPLHVYADDELLLFASEIKAMGPWRRLRPDRRTLHAYLLGFGGPTKGFTGFEGVRTLAPGEMWRIDAAGEASVEPFFELDEFWDPDALDRWRRARPDDAVDELDRLLQDSVDAHMFADARVGAFCSGGVDSSILTAMAARSRPDLVIVHADVRGRWSERDAAQALADHLDLELLTVPVEDHDFVRRIPEVVEHYEHPPTYHPNCAPLMMVAHLARNSGVKGLLSGEGSDECFLGYPWLGRKRLTDAWRTLGRAVRRTVRSIPAVGPILWPWDGDGHRLVRGVLSRFEIEDDEARNRERAAALGSGRIDDAGLWTADYMGHHLRTLLHRNDTMGMAASIEARFPFLDHRVVAFAANLRGSLKLRFSPTVFEKAHPFVRDKWVVRKVADRYLPRHLSRRIKIGFWTTVLQRLDVDPAFFRGSWVQHELQLSDAQIARTATGADQDLRMRLLHLDVWGRLMLEGDDREVVRASILSGTSIRSE